MAGPVDIDVARLSTIGYICVLWASFEANFAHAIWVMLDLDIEAGKIVTGGLDIRPRANMAVNLARQLKAPADLLKVLEEGRQALDDGLLQRRNLIVHGIHHLRESRADPILLELHRGKAKGKQEVSDAELRKLRDDIYNANRALHRAVDKFIAESIA